MYESETTGRCSPDVKRNPVLDGAAIVLLSLLLLVVVAVAVSTLVKLVPHID